MEKREPLCTIAVDINCYSHYGKSMGFLQKNWYLFFNEYIEFINCTWNFWFVKSSRKMKQVWERKNIVYFAFYATGSQLSIWVTSRLIYKYTMAFFFLTACTESAWVVCPQLTGWSLNTSREHVHLGVLSHDFISVHLYTLFYINFYY